MTSASILTSKWRRKNIDTVLTSSPSLQTRQEALTQGCSERIHSNLFYFTTVVCSPSRRVMDGRREKFYVPYVETTIQVLYQTTRGTHWMLCRCRTGEWVLKTANSSMKIKLLQTETIKCRPYDFELFSYYIVFRIFGERSFLLRRGFINSSTVPRVDL